MGTLLEQLTTVEADASATHTAIDDATNGLTAIKTAAATAATQATAAAGSAASADTKLDALGPGTGARTVTVTVNDGSTALESASVRYTKGVLSYLKATNASGNATFNLDDGTWTVAVTLAGYTFTGTTLVVNGNETPTYSMTAQTITSPADISLCTVQFRVKLGNTAVAGAVCKAKLLGINQAADGTILSNVESSDTTDVSGIAELQLVRKDAIVKGNGKYKITVEYDGKPVSNVTTTIPSQSTILFEDLL